MGAEPPTIPFEERFEAARGRLLRICMSLVGPDAAEDVVHDTYLLARRRQRQLRDPSAYDAWLNRIAVNRCYDHHRSSRRSSRLAFEVAQSTPPSDLALRDMIEQLPPRQRTVLVLHYGYGFRLDEIGDILGLTHTNVRTIIARARERLLRAWQEAES